MEKTKILIGILAVMVLIIGIGIVIAHEDFNQTKQLVDSKISCDKLNDEQIEEIGDYLMEQMHPGEAHEAMHNMMGGEESETVKLMHINMAKMMYCNNGEGMSNMMGMMNMMSGDGGMMNGMAAANYGMMGNNMMSSGMAGNWQYGYGYWNFINVLYIVLLIGLVILVYFLIIKLRRK